MNQKTKAFLSDLVDVCLRHGVSLVGVDDYSADEKFAGTRFHFEGESIRDRVEMDELKKAIDAAKQMLSGRPAQGNTQSYLAPNDPTGFTAGGIADFEVMGFVHLYPTISGLRFDLHESGRPADALIGYDPIDAVRRAWIPQTIAEQVWVLYEFASKAAREQWEANLPPRLAKFLDRSVIPAALPYGWAVRDINGFEVGGEV